MEELLPVVGTGESEWAGRMDLWIWAVRCEEKWVGGKVKFL
jgi:hypothetical protein